MDDTVVYIFDGSVKKKEKFRLVSRRFKKTAGINSIYIFDESNTMRGMRVNLTFTFSAVGTNAPLFVSVVGLIYIELPEDICISMWIEELCIRDGGVNVGWKGDSWLVLMRGSSEYNDSPDRQTYKYYRDSILVPFASQSRIFLMGLMMNQMYQSQPILLL